MKRKIFTLLFCGALASGFAYAQDASDFGANDVLISNFEDVNPVVTDSLWTDTLMTTPVTAQSANIAIVDNPDQFINVSTKAAMYTRPMGGWRSIYIRLNQSIILSQTPNLQMQIFPVSGSSPKKTSVSISLVNDKGEVTSAGGYQGDIEQDAWSTVTILMGKFKSSAKYNAIQIQINNGDSVANSEDTQYYIDQIGFKANADGVELPSTVFYETFGGYNSDWEQGKVLGQHQYPKADGSGFDGPGEYGTAEAYASIDGFTSGIPFTFRDLVADTVGTFIARGWGMSANYNGASGGGRIQFRSFVPGTLETGNVDIAGFSDLNLSFGFGTQTYWAFNGEIPNSRPKVEISVDGGDFYEIYSNSDFMLPTGEEKWPGWGDSLTYKLPLYEDSKFKLVEYPCTNIEGAPLASANTINLRISYKAGADFWIDDLWLAGTHTLDAVSAPKVNELKVYPNPAKDFIVTPNALKVTITDLNGRELINSFNVEKVTVSGLATGVYLVKMVNQEGTVFGKFVKE